MLKKNVLFKFKTLTCLVACFSGLFYQSFCAVPASAHDAAPLPFKDLGVSTGDGSCKFRTYFHPTHEIPLSTNNAKLLVGSMINADYYAVRRAETLNDENKDDARDQFRQRTELSVHFKYGTNNPDERASVETRITLGNTLFMRQNYKASLYHDKSLIKGGLLDENFSPIQTNFQEAWFKVNFDRLMPQMDKHPHFLQVGYFPYLVGRGISLGDWSLGGVDYMGFRKTGLQSYAPMYPPGLLWRGQANKYCSYDVYLSPMVTEDVAGANFSENVKIALPKESLSSRHIVSVSAKLGWNFDEITDKVPLKGSQAMLNPYWVYYNSPRQTVDRGADAPIDFHTFGIMAEAKAEGFEVNIEVAKQVGRQTIREAVYHEYPSVNHFDPTTGQFRKLPDSMLPAELVAKGWKNPNRWMPGDGYPTLGASDVFWSEQDVTQRLAEHHPSYDIDLAGWMLCFDARYSFKNYPVIAAIAGGFFSGDSYPYNDNVDNYFGSAGASYHDQVNGKVAIKPEGTKKYRGFLPLRDREYSGLWAHPLVMVNAGILPRPKNIDLFDLSSRNDEDTLTNLIYFGGCISIRPMEDREKMRVNTNVFAYWNDERLKKWDKKALPPTRLVQNEGVFNGTKKRYDDYNIEGWLSDETASKFLGWEINTIINYKITENLDLSARGGIFFPGGLFSDLSGQPNDNTIIDQTELDASLGGQLNNIVAYKGLGNDKAYGFYLRLRYVF